MYSISVYQYIIHTYILVSSVETLALAAHWWQPALRGPGEFAATVLRFLRRHLRHPLGLLGNVGIEIINHPFLMVGIPPIKLVMNGGWCQWHCYTNTKSLMLTPKKEPPANWHLLLLHLRPAITRFQIFIPEVFQHLERNAQSLNKT